MKPKTRIQTIAKCPKCRCQYFKQIERDVRMCVICGWDDIPRLKPIKTERVDKSKSGEYNAASV